MNPISQNLHRFGLKTTSGGTHSARTMMLPDLTRLLSWVENTDATKIDYKKAIDRHNCLGKRSARTRLLTAWHLTALYGLDPSLTLFRNLRYVWHRIRRAAPSSPCPAPAPGLPSCGPPPHPVRPLMPSWWAISPVAGVRQFSPARTRPCWIDRLRAEWSWRRRLPEKGGLFSIESVMWSRSFSLSV